MSTGQRVRSVGDRYSLLTVIGRGGMGAVWRAEDILLRREVAIKEVQVPPELPDPEQTNFSERILREARAAARLNHPGAVTIFDVVEIEGECPYIVMELVEAPTLEDIVRQEGALPAEEVARIGGQLADALSVAHEKGIVHRDVKPSNVMLVENRAVKLTDFGIATVKGDPRITATGLVLGSPNYMAPEQAEGRSSGPPTDVWGLGATLYYALTARVPFDRGSAIATLAAVVHDDVQVSPGQGRVGELVCRMLDKDPAGRPPMPEVRALLERNAPRAIPTSSATQVLAPPTSDVGEPRPEGDGYEDVDDEVAEASEPPQKKVFMGVAILLLLVAVAAFLVLRAAMEEPTGTGSERRAGSPEARERGGAAGIADGGPEDAVANDAVATEEWTTYESAEGFSIEYPSDWEEMPGRGGPTTIDFVEPETGNYLRLGYRTPPGTDVLGTLEGIMDDLASRHPDYVEIRIESTEYRGYEAAIAEYKFSGMHAVNLQFVSGPPEPGEYGFALNFVTSEEDWESYMPLFEHFQETFTAP